MPSHTGSSHTQLPFSYHESGEDVSDGLLDSRLRQFRKQTVASNEESEDISLEDRPSTTSASYSIASQEQLMKALDYKGKQRASDIIATNEVINDSLSPKFAVLGTTSDGAQDAANHCIQADKINKVCTTVI